MKNFKLLPLGLIWLLGFIKKQVMNLIALLKKKTLKYKVLENTFPNQQLAKYLNGKGKKKGIRIILVNLTQRRSRYGKLFVLMSMPTPENIITGIIGKIKAVDQPIRSKEIIDACALSTNPAILPATIIIYRAHLATFNALFGAPRKAAWKIVYKDLKALLYAFQLAANNDQPNAITILESGKFRIKGVSSKQRQVFSLANGVDSGTLELTGNMPLKGICLHDWWISYDLGLTYVRLEPTLESTTEVTGLTKGKEIFIRHQFITRRGKDNGPLETLSKTVT